MQPALWGDDILAGTPAPAEVPPKGKPPKVPPLPDGFSEPVGCDTQPPCVRAALAGHLAAALVGHARGQVLTDELYRMCRGTLYALSAGELVRVCQGLVRLLGEGS